MLHCLNPVLADSKLSFCNILHWLPSPCPWAVPTCLNTAENHVCIRLYWILLKLIDTFANLSLRDWFKTFCFTTLRLYPLPPSKLGTNLIPSHHSFQGHGRTRSYLDCKGNQVTPQNMYVYIYIYFKHSRTKARARNGCKAALFKNKKILWNDWPCLRVERIVTVRSIRPGWQPEPDRVCVRQG